MKNVGLALGGGGVRGLAHIMALEALDEAGIRPTIIAGTSMGCIIGALYASGWSGKKIREEVEAHSLKKGEGLKDAYRKKEAMVKWLKIFKPTAANSALMKVDGLMRYLREDLRVENFEELEIPFRAVATDFYRGEPVVFSKGPLVPAIQASMSIPGVFAPVEHEGRVLVDGGLTNQVPYDLLQDECDVTIAIDVGPTFEPGETKSPPALEAILGMFDITVDQVVKARLKERPPTIYIRPRLTGIQVLEFNKIETVFERAQPAIEELKTKLAALSDGPSQGVP
jgi:NTE family protein